MTNLPAVCPLCARVNELDPQKLPESLCCEGCGAMLTPSVHGLAVILTEKKAGPPPEKPEVEELLKRAAREQKPDRAYALISQALEADPESFAAHRALLYHGKLYKVVRHPGDYSLIKCYLMHMFEEPKQYTVAQRDAQIKELFHDPLLARTCALSGDEDAFLREYLGHLAGEYLRIFVRGRNTVGQGIFGFARSAETVRVRCAEIATGMERNVRTEERLTEEQRELLCEALRCG